MKTLKAQPLTSKHIRIQDTIRRNIVSGQWHGGELIPSAKELGKMHGTSALTARKAMENLISKGVLVAKQGLGTFVSVRPTLQHVGVLLGVGNESAAETVLEPGRYLRLIEASCNRWAERHLLKIRTYIYHSDEENLAPTNTFWSDVCERTLDGVILVAIPSQRLAKELLRKGLPIIAIGGVPASVPYRVQPDYRHMIFEAIRLNFQAGRKRLGLIGGVTIIGDLKLTPVKDQFAAACLEYQIPVDFSLVKTVNSMTASEGYRCTLELLDHASPPDGLIVSDDILAQGVCRALVERGVHVPKQMTLVTHSNAGGAPISFPVPLTRLEFDPTAMVEQAAEMLTSLMRGEPPGECVRLCKPTLVRGESC